MSQERGAPINDETAHAAGGADPATEAVPDLPTAEAAALAWSADTELIADDDGRRPLPRSLLALLLLVAVGALVLAMIVAGHHRGGQNPYRPPTSRAPATVTVTATPSITAPPSSGAPPPAATAPPAPAHTGADAAFLAAMHADGVPYRSGDADAIVSAHEVCNALADGSTMADETSTVRRGLGWTYGQSSDFVADAVAAYCPTLAR